MGKLGIKYLRRNLIRQYGVAAVKRLEQEQYNLARPLNRPGRGFYHNLYKHPEQVIATLCKWALTD